MEPPRLIRRQKRQTVSLKERDDIVRLCSLSNCNPDSIRNKNEEESVRSQRGDRNHANSVADEADKFESRPSLKSPYDHTVRRHYLNDCSENLDTNTCTSVLLLSPRDPLLSKRDLVLSSDSSMSEQDFDAGEPATAINLSPGCSRQGNGEDNEDEAASKKNCCHVHLVGEKAAFEISSFALERKLPNASKTNFDSFVESQPPLGSVSPRTDQPESEELPFDGILSALGSQILAIHANKWPKITNKDGNLTTDLRNVDDSSFGSSTETENENQASKVPAELDIRITCSTTGVDMSDCAEDNGACPILSSGCKRKVNQMSQHSMKNFDNIEFTYPGQQVIPGESNNSLSTIMNGKNKEFPSSLGSEFPTKEPCKVKDTSDEVAQVEQTQQHVTVKTMEPTHMTWEEVMFEAQMQGVPLWRSVSSSPFDSKELSKLKKNRDSSTPQEKFKTSCLHRKSAIFNLRTWLDKLNLSSGQKSAARRQHISSSCDRNTGRASTDGLPQRRSQSASSTPRYCANRSGPSNNRSDKSTRRPPGICSLSSASSSSRQSSYGISASGSRGSTNSFLSTSMMVSPSTGSLCSVFSRSSRDSTQGIPTSTTPRSRGGKGSSGHELTGSPHELTGSPPNGHDSSSPASLLPSESPRASSSSWSPISQVQLEKNGAEQRSNMQQLKNCDWYWGALDREAASRLLSEVPDGTFLLRDSLDDRYLFSLSFNSQGDVHHSRIEHHKGTFSFASQENPLSSPSVLDLVKKGVAHCRQYPYIYCLTPRPPCLNPVPVRLLYPLKRSPVPPSLRGLCQTVIDSTLGC